VGATATQGVLVHREKDKKEANLWVMVITWNNWNLIREKLGTIGLKEGAVKAHGE
jgi:hypothetical protein